jgi:hypothetical protein
MLTTGCSLRQFDKAQCRQAQGRQDRRQKTQDKVYEFRVNRLTDYAKNDNNY